ncbi:glycosyltransferase family 2 protein [Haladaptatus sp. DYSN1]|uniref:glycosyltransferase family 2 protein n=1 Tax=unclassified Haladaptatus TaxID=2622732 RepID=UPI0024051450|nr:glycosyltransferase family 2 protein [Haladaptatus sp. DYSN1]
MYRGQRIGVVVPAYNEARLIGRVIETMPAFVDRIYVFNDHSTDDTWNAIQHAARVANQRVASEGEYDERVVGVNNPANMGVGGCVKHGFGLALADGIDIVARMDGDGQMDPTQLSRLLDPIIDGVADFSKGNRLWYKAYHRDMSRWRLFGNSVLTGLTKVASGYWKMVDPQNGFCALSRRTLETIPFEQLYEGYGFENDLLVMCNVYDQRLAEVAHPAVYGEEISDIHYASFVPHLSAILLRTFLWRLKMKFFVYDFHPAIFAYIIGTFGLAFGVVATLLVGSGVLTGTAGLTDGLLLFSVFLLSSLLLILAVSVDVERNADLVVLVHHKPTVGEQATEHVSVSVSSPDEESFGRQRGDVQ